MVLSRVQAVFDRAKSEIHRSFTEEYTPRQTAGSFSLGVFITMLPTLGTGLILFVVLAWAINRINRIALFASVIVFNPVVKWGVYGTSFALGTTILGPVPGVTRSAVSLSAGSDIVVRLLVGNLILAVLATVIAYLAAFRLVSAYEHDALPVVGGVTDLLGSDDGNATPDGESVECADGGER
ncbi:DUF2062 domain-containing protein [Halorubrum sp. DTA46]|uniref:DUF2062 domain-containing protein n=1 Tax=Halorubrum sp. DTA46 TaxID=3402162 RepID=UPI003AAC730E